MTPAHAELVNLPEDSEALEDIFERQGFEISRATQSVWCGDVADLVEPLYELMAGRVRASHVVATDDTIMPMLAKGKTANARMWVYVGDQSGPYNVFDFTLNRGRDQQDARSSGADASYPVFVHRLAHLLYASFRPRLATVALAFSLALHRHQVGQGTFTPRLLNMPSTRLSLLRSFALGLPALPGEHEQGDAVEGQVELQLGAAVLGGDPAGRFQ